MVPRLRKSGSAGRPGFCLIIGRIYGSRMQASCRLATGQSADRPNSAHCRHARRARQETSPFRPRRPAPSVSFCSPRSGNLAAMVPPKPPPDPAAGGWSGRFSEPVAERVKRFTASVDFDRRLAAVDIAGSLAHARMLAAVGVLSAADLAAIERGMATIRGEIERGEFAWSRDLEDVHLNIEHRLTALAGDAGKRLHTARSRNDQVATDLRLWLRGAIDALGGRSCRPAARAPRPRRAPCRHDHAGIHAPAGRAARHFWPPFARLRRDARPRHGALRRLPPARQPAAARRRGARRNELSDRPRAGRQRARFRRRLCPNSLDAVSDRDFAIEFAAAATLGHAAPVALRRRARAVDEPAFRLRAARRPLLHRQLDHAAEEEPGCPRARARQDRAASSAASWR